MQRLAMRGFLTFLLLLAAADSYKLSMFYCGFSGDYCGQSIHDDVLPQTSLVILAFANTLPDGTVVADEDNFPGDLTAQWKRTGKQIVLSVGGQNGNWAYVFASEDSISRFTDSLVKLVKKFKLDGVDLDVQSYLAPPRTVANMIIKLKKMLNSQVGSNILVVSPEDVAVYQGAPVPSPDAGGQPFNYFVPIIQLADSSIDIYQPQAYNNWYDGLPGGSRDYFYDVYLNWRNLQGLSPWGKPLENFQGVAQSKLRIGLLASPSAGQGAYYGSPSTISEFISLLKQKGYGLNGFMIWDSHWDSLNGNAISSICSQKNQDEIVEELQ